MLRNESETDANKQIMADLDSVTLKMCISIPHSMFSNLGFWGHLNVEPRTNGRK